jgi:hypothetical protein
MIDMILCCRGTLIVSADFETAEGTLTWHEVSVCDRVREVRPAQKSYFQITYITSKIPGMHQKETDGLYLLVRL